MHLSEHSECFSCLNLLWLNHVRTSGILLCAFMESIQYDLIRLVLYVHFEGLVQTSVPSVRGNRNIMYFPCSTWGLTDTRVVGVRLSHSDFHGTHGDTLRHTNTLNIHTYTVADLGRGKGTPLWRLVMYFCVNNCTSPSNDYTAVACSNNNQAQLYTHSRISSLLISRRLTRPRVASRYSVRTFTWPEVGVATQKFLDALHVPVAEPPFLNF